MKIINVINDISCNAYDGGNAVPRQCPIPSTQHSPNPTIQHSPNPTLQNSLNPTIQRTPNPTTQNNAKSTLQYPNTAKQQGYSEDGNPRDKGKNTYYAHSY